MENPEKRRVDVLLFPVGPLKPEQAPAILAAAARIAFELSGQRGSKNTYFGTEGRLEMLVYYCKKHAVPFERCESGSVYCLENTAQKSGCLYSGKAPYSDPFYDVRIGEELLARIADVQCLLYDGAEPDAWVYAHAIRRARERSGKETVFVPV